jgi:membrane-bound lytic murein transglycosylase A
MISRRAALAATLVFCLLAGPALARSTQPGSMKFPDATLEGIGWGALDGWTADDHAASFLTFLASCRAIIPHKPAPSARRFVGAMKEACHRARAAGKLDNEAARAFFEENFRPLRIAKGDDPIGGFLTGYYEPIVEGSRVPTPEYTVPLYRRPGDLLAAGGKKKKSGAFSNKGKVYRRVGKKTVAYFDRPEIEDGALDGRHLEICWLKDPIEAFFIHIQGSARVRLEDGTMLRVNYDAHNGHPYLPVGRILIERGEVTKEEMSMDKIRQWMMAQPDGGRDLRRMNKSFVFFRVTGLADHEEAIGAQGVQLTPWRSIAIDRHLHPYGTLFWIEADLPIESELPATKFRRLMIGQDTGSAIIGAARADIYFGAGAEAGSIGGRIKQPGRFVMLVPRALDPFEKWRSVPMPPLRDEVRPVAVERDWDAKRASAATPTSAATPGTVPLPQPSPRKVATAVAPEKPAAAAPATKRSTTPLGQKKTAVRPAAANETPTVAKPKAAAKKSASTESAAKKTATPVEKKEPSTLRRMFGLDPAKPAPKANGAKKKSARQQ